MRASVESLFSLAGEVALVTGASRGIGRAIAATLAGAGAHVVLNGRDAAALEQCRAELAADGLDVSTAAFDIADGAAVREAVGRIVAERGRVDIAIGNAGQSLRGPIERFTAADIAHLTTVNLGAAVLLAQAVAAAMAPGGRIVLTGSMLGHLARPNNALYAATKAGVAGLARALAVELGPRGIRCNVVAPGAVRTAMTATLAADPAVDAMIRQTTPLGRWGTPQDIAGAALFLASRASAFVTGQVLLVDGGKSASA